MFVSYNREICFVLSVLIRKGCIGHDMEEKKPEKRLSLEFREIDKY